MLAARYLSGRAKAWANLRAWGSSLADVNIGFQPYNEATDRQLGRAYHDSSEKPAIRCIMVWVTGYLCEDLETIIHEYAHHAVGCGAGHAKSWYERLAVGVTEATGFEAPPWHDCVDLPVVKGSRLYDGRVTAHLVAWLEQSGRAERFRAAGIPLWKADDDNGKAALLGA